MSKQAEQVRLFVALDIPSVARDCVVGVQEEWRRYEGLTARFTPPHNLHLTLKFLGEQPAERLDDIAARLEAVRLPPVECWLGELGLFSADGPLRIMWIHLAGEAVIELQQAIDAALADEFEAERQFMSHLTIARIKRVSQRRRFLEAVGACRVPECRFTVREFSLKRSILTADGAQYDNLRVYPLEQAATS